MPSSTTLITLQEQTQLKFGFDNLDRNSSPILDPGLAFEFCLHYVEQAKQEIFDASHP